jgi:hypothetical protein
MVVTDPIEVGGDYDPIGAELSPDVNAESFRAWETQFQRGAPFDFAQAIVPAFQSFPSWFETPDVTARIAYDTTVNYVASFHSPRAGDFHHIVVLYGQQASWQLHLASAYVARMVRAQDGRTSLMHGVMKRSIDILRASTQRAVNELRAGTNRVNTGVLNEAKARIAADNAEVKNRNAAILHAAKVTGDNANAWALTHIAKPIVDQANVDRANTVKAIADTKVAAHNDALAVAAAVVAPLALAVAAMQSQLGALQTESDECTKPMCDTMGPKTDLGKLLKGINIAKWLALLAFAETVDIKTLEHIAVLAAGVEGDVGSWIAQRVLGELEG